MWPVELELELNEEDEETNFNISEVSKQWNYCIHNGVGRRTSPAKVGHSHDPLKKPNALIS